MTKKKSKPAEKAEEPTIEEEPVVTSVTDVVPESPPEMQTETAPEDYPVEESTVESVVSDVVEGMVTAKALMDVGFIDPVDGQTKWYKKGETFTTTKERVESLDQRYVQIV